MADDDAGGGAAPAEGTAVCKFSGFKSRKKSANLRKKRQADSDEDDDDTGVVKKGKVAKKENPLAVTTKTGEKRDLETAFTSNREVQVHTDMGATREIESETQTDRDTRALREQVLKRAVEGGGEPAADDKLYRGKNSYIDYKEGFRREHTLGNEKSQGAHGPLRAPTNVRYSARFDYQPDICKDYKETGYCGYGDSCKFMHDRGDYKAGWQIEKEWDEKEKLRKERIAQGLLDGKEGSDDSGSDDEDELPFACFICRDPFVDPVVTKCKHYFCEHCALKHNAKNKTCFVCEKPTGGTFNVAHEIIKRNKDEAKK